MVAWVYNTHLIQAVYSPFSDMDEPYKNREIQEMFNDLKQSLDRIESQTTGLIERVNELEKKESAHSAVIKFAKWSIPSLLGILMAVSGWLILQVIDLKIQQAEMPGIIQQAVSQTVPPAVQSALLPYTK